MKPTQKTACSLAAALITFGSLVGGANAAIVIRFEEVPPETGSSIITTTATATGFLDLTGVTPFRESTSGITTNSTSASFNSSGELFSFGTFDSTGSSDYYSGFPVATTLSFSRSPQVGTDTTFRIFSGFLYLPSTASDNEIFSADEIVGRWEWRFGGGLDFLGLGDLTTTPTTVFQLDGGVQDTIQFALVPEPASSVLLGLGGLAFLARRKRTS
jgi:hypothetical protein